jgi:hypothetical protein
MWAFDARHITIQYNEAYRNLTVSEDGEGFDLDGGVSDSVLQYNYAHDNQGMGFLVCACVESYEMHNNVVRYNVSQNDGTTGQPNALEVLGGEPFSNLEVFNNSFYSAAGGGPLVFIGGEGHRFSQLHLRNNLLAVGAGKPLLEFPDPADASGLATQGRNRGGDSKRRAGGAERRPRSVRARAGGSDVSAVAGAARCLRAARRLTTHRHRPESRQLVRHRSRIA